MKQVAEMIWSKTLIGGSFIKVYIKITTHVRILSFLYDFAVQQRGTVGCTSDSYVEVVGSSPVKGPRCLLEQNTLPLLLSTGWFQERIGAWFHNQTKINWGPYGRFT